MVILPLNTLFQVTPLTTLFKDHSMLLDALLDIFRVILATVLLEAEEAQEEALDEAPELLATTVPEGLGASAALEARAATAASRSTAASLTTKLPRTSCSSTGRLAQSSGSRRRPST